jgi:hypothetical protein
MAIASTTRFSIWGFSESIAKNVKEKRFARGGSTISMHWKE